MRKFELYFYGYTWEEYAFQISSFKGVFVVYQGRLDSEGGIDIKDILYVGFHNGIIDLYENGVINSIRQYIEPGNRYNPKGVRSDLLNIQLVNKGNCKFIPNTITF